MTLGIHIQHNTFKTDMSSKQEILKKYVFPPYHKRWSKRKFPLRNRTSDLRIPRSDALPLSHRDSMVSKTITKFIYDTSCILLGSALSIACLQIEYETWLILSSVKKYIFVNWPSWKDEETSFSVSSPSSKFTISLFLFTRNHKFYTIGLTIFLRPSPSHRTAIAGSFTI